jgi:hypothetical protein
MARSVAVVVSARPHAAGTQPPRSFDEAVRDAVRSSPYLTLSLLVHALLLVLFVTAPPPVTDKLSPIINASPEVARPPVPEPPPPPEQRLEPPVDHTDVVETVAPFDPSDQPDMATADLASPFATADSGDPNAIMGVGPGPSEPGGPPGGGRGKMTGRGDPSPHDPTIDAALAWLARHQEDDGHWSSAGFDGRCAVEGGACDGLGQPQFDVGVTGLALLAFLGAGNSHRGGDERWRGTVHRGLQFLVREAQAPDGNYGSPDFAQHTYDHAIATLALVEAWSLTGDIKLQEPAVRGLRHLSASRNPGGAWRYAAFHPEMALRPNDVSVTGWVLLALTLAREYGLPVDEVALEDGLAFLDEMTDPATGVTGYTERGGRPARERGTAEIFPAEQSESMTAVALLCRIFADPNLERPGNREAVERAADVVARLPPLWDDALPGRRDYYAWYYGTTAMFQVGGARWTAWQKTLVPAVAQHQRRDGDAHGSWDPQLDPWGGQGGRVYSTAILALTLEAFHRYESVLGAHDGPRPR